MLELALLQEFRPKHLVTQALEGQLHLMHQSNNLVLINTYEYFFIREERGGKVTILIQLITKYLQIYLLL